MMCRKIRTENSSEKGGTLLLEGIVIKTLNSYYYIQHEQTVFVCKLRGRFKKERYSITVGDRVRFEQLTDETGIIEAVMPRHSVLIS